MKFTFGDITVDTSARELRRGIDVIDIEPRAYELLAYLLENRERAVGKDELQDKVWGTIVSDSAMTRSVMKLRKSMQDSSESIIKTVPRFGYRFVAAIDGDMEQEPALDQPVSRSWTNVSPVLVAAVGAMLLVIAYVWWQPEVVDKSVAVLPFDDLSEAQDQRWFADGLSEEILNALARTPDLLVAARTSSFAYSGTDKNITTIASELGVAHILEGSVRRDGERLRVTAQLIRAGDGFHVWSETFDHSYADLITIQEAVATEIAIALETTMDPEKLALFVSSGTASVPAFELYLQGLSQYDSMVQTGNVETYTNSIGAFERAVEIDPEFAFAWGQIAEYWATQMSSTGILSQMVDDSPDEMKENYENAMDAAIRHANDPVTELGFRTSKANTQMKMRQALQFNTELLRQRPFDRWAPVRQVNLLTQLNMHEEAVRFAVDVFERDGRDPVMTARSLLALAYSGDLEATEKMAEVSAERFKNHAIAMYQIQRAFLWTGNIAKARDVYNLIEASDMPEANRYLAHLRQLCAEGKVDEAEALFVASSEYSNARLSVMWLSHATLGNHAAAADVWRPIDELNDPALFGGMLGYGNFDPQEYPNLMLFLETNGNEPGPVSKIPYRCKD